MITYAEAVAAIAAIAPPIAVETIPLAAARGRALAEDVRLDRDQPGFDRATMDGYALAPDGAATAFPVLGAVHAGEAWPRPLRPGEAVRIMTGAPVPAGATVVPIEQTDRGEARVTVTEPKALAPGRNIARRGEDGHRGDTVVCAGTRLAPATLAVAAMAGAATVAVRRWPRVAIITTGDEVGGAGEAGIMDSNGPLLEALCAALGIAATRAHAGDDAGSLSAAIEAAMATADIVVTTGGVSAGAKDLVPGLASAAGFAAVFHHVAIQPGKPVFLARRGDGRCLIGLPGNPVSVLATAHLFLLPLLGRWLGGWAPTWLELPLATPFAHGGKRHLFLPARLVPGGVAPIAWNGSGDLIAAAAGDGLVDLPIGTDATPGTRVRFLPYLGSTPGERGIIPPRG
jgi:molybdopterin molybdotransferase